MRVRKLQHCFIGPYKIIKTIGAVAYELELPAMTRMHPVFHVSLLQKKNPMDEEVNRIQLRPPIYKIYSNGDQEYKVEQIVDHHRKSHV